MRIVLPVPTLCGSTLQRGGMMPSVMHANQAMAGTIGTSGTTGSTRHLRSIERFGRTADDLPTSADGTTLLLT